MEWTDQACQANCRDDHFSLANTGLWGALGGSECKFSGESEEGVLSEHEGGGNSSQIVNYVQPLEMEISTYSVHSNVKVK